MLLSGACTLGTCISVYRLLHGQFLPYCCSSAVKQTLCVFFLVGVFTSTQKHKPQLRLKGGCATGPTIPSVLE